MNFKKILVLIMITALSLTLISCGTSKAPTEEPTREGYEELMKQRDEAVDMARLITILENYPQIVVLDRSEYNATEEKLFKELEGIFERNPHFIDYMLEAANQKP